MLNSISGRQASPENPDDEAQREWQDVRQQTIATLVDKVETWAATMVIEHPSWTTNDLSFEHWRMSQRYRDTIRKHGEPP
jgi:hypothetical protein